MNIFEGLEQFGFENMKSETLFEETKVTPKQAKKDAGLPDKEEDLLFERNIRCTVCDCRFNVKVVKTSRIRRLEPDWDLRPRFSKIDPLKYDVYSCPKCGYSALAKQFEHISQTQIHLLKDQVAAKFVPSQESATATISYERALQMYKLALLCAVVKRGHNSEKGYLCLKMAWLCRGREEELVTQGISEEATERLWVKEMEQAYYEQAYEGLTKAQATEPPPICGMDSATLDLLLGEMAYYLEHYEDAGKHVSRVLQSFTVSQNAKDRAVDLKNRILEKRKG